MVGDTTLFERSGDELIPSEHAVGPWPDGRLHGGAIAGLAAELFDMRCPAAWHVAALRVELLGPVPRARMRAETTEIRAGRRMAIWDMALRSGGALAARATATFVADDVTGPDAVRSLTTGAPGEGRAPSRRVASSSPFFEGIDFRIVAGDIGVPGPARLWTHVAHRWLADRDPCGVARIAAVAGVAYGYGLPVPSDEWLVMNLDLTLHLLRRPEGTWTYLDAVADLGPGGGGVGHAEIGDATGRVGRVGQAVVAIPHE